MNTDDLFNSCSSKSVSPLKQTQSAVESPKHSTFGDDFQEEMDQDFVPTTLTLDTTAPNTAPTQESPKFSAERLNIDTKTEGSSSASATLLLGARHFFKDSLVHFPDENIPNLEKHRLFIVELASFFQNGSVMSDTLLSLMIVQYSALDLTDLVKVVLQTANTDQVDESEIRSKIDKLATYEYYGIEVDGLASKEDHLQLYRWRLRSVIIEGVPDELKVIVCDLDSKRMQFKADLNSFYSKLHDDDRAKLKKRKGLFDSTPAKRQKPNSAAVSEKAKASGTSTGKKKKAPKLTAAEKAEKEEERLIKLREKEEEKARKEEEKAKKEEEKAKKEEEKAKKMEEKLRAQEEKEVAKNKALEEKNRKQMEKEKDRKSKEDAKEAERVKKEMLKQKEERSQKKLSGFFKPLEKKAPTAPVKVAVSDFSLRFLPFTPKATAIVAPINRFDHQIDACQFKAIMNLQNESLAIMDMKKMFDTFRKSATLVKAQPRVPRINASLVAPNSWRYLKFVEDVRPPYYGTWTKKSTKVTGKTPFGQDYDLFDYDFDSEAEWEEDEPGEDLVSEDEELDAKEEEEEGEEEGWVVPHGYLSDDEGDALEKDVYEPIRGKARNFQPKVIQTLVPILRSPSYTFEGIPSALTVEVLYKIRNPFQLDPNSAEVMRKKGSGIKKSSFPSDLTGDLATFIVANDALALPKLVERFVSQFSIRNLTKVAVEAEIRRIAMREKRLGDAKPRWHPKESLFAPSSLSEPLASAASTVNIAATSSVPLKEVVGVEVQGETLDKENLPVIST